MSNQTITASTKDLFSVKTLTKIGILSAVATLLMLFEVPLWFAPSFYKLDLSELPVLIGTFALGPVAGIFIEFIKVLLNFVLNGTVTGGVGELSNFIIGCALVVPAGIIYKHKKSLKFAIIASAVGVVSMTIIGSAMNYIFILPMYSALGLMPMDAIINAGNVLNPYIVDKLTFVAYAVMPFNLIKGVVVVLPTMLIYKRISKILHT